MGLALDLPIPRRLAARPRDERGLPIPFVVLVVNGRPDFRITDLDRWKVAVEHRKCALCGEGLGTLLAFIGGPKSMHSHAFTDSAMHRECAEYAIRVCPYLALPNMKRTSHMAAYEGVALGTLKEVVEERPERFGLGMTKSYEIERMPGSNAVIVVAGEWLSVDWYRHGQPVEAPAAVTR